MEQETISIITLVLQTVTLIPVFVSMSYLFGDRYSTWTRLLVSIAVTGFMAALLRRVTLAFGVGDDITSLAPWRIAIALGALLEWTLIASLAYTIDQSRIGRNAVAMARELRALIQDYEEGHREAV